MKIALVYPPTCDPTAPYLAVPMLTGFLRANGVEVVPVDANVEAYDRLLRPAPLRALAERVGHRLRKLDRRAALDHAARRAYLQLWRARGDAEAAPDGIAEARAVLKDEARFFDAVEYERAVETIESALRLVSAAHAPLELTFSGYRTPFALTTPDEIADDARAERDPFDDYVCNVLAPRLREARVDAIGISVCFPGQLQPAYAFALKLKRLLPEVHLTCGGPGLTQLFI
ncbi:MAG: B12-binding domain-containing radical SAM protein, partial [Polyangia bacterium]